jgi:hypothetical protein
MIHGEEMDIICTRFRCVLGAVFYAKTPLYIYRLGLFLSMDAFDMKYTLRPLRSVLLVSHNISEPMWVFYLSFADFSKDAQWCTDT